MRIETTFTPSEGQTQLKSQKHHSVKGNKKMDTGTPETMAESLFVAIERDLAEQKKLKEESDPIFQGSWEDRNKVERKKRSPKIPDESFVRLHFESRTVQDLVSKTGLTLQAVNARIKSMKKAGVKLKELQKNKAGGKLDVAALNAILDELNGV